jgi:hypothetical protein
MKNPRFVFPGIFLWVGIRASDSVSGYPHVKPPDDVVVQPPAALVPPADANRDILRVGRLLLHCGQTTVLSRSECFRSSSKSEPQSGQWYSKIGIVVVVIFGILMDWSYLN